MRHVPSPVTIVTVSAAGERRGATIGSFTSVSLEPPLVSFNVMKGTGFHRLIRQAGDVAIHVLSENQAELAEHFAQPDMTETEQFEEVDLRGDRSPSSPPILRDVQAILHGHVDQTIPVGDHHLVIVRVKHVETSVREGAVTGGPLLYLAGAYRGIGNPVDLDPTTPPEDDERAH